MQIPGPASLLLPGHLCEANPQVKFLFTVLSRTDQHEAMRFQAYAALKDFLTNRIWRCTYADLGSIVQTLQGKRLASTCLRESISTRDDLTMLL